MIGFPLSLTPAWDGKVIGPAIITGSCVNLVGLPDTETNYAGPVLLPEGTLYAQTSYISYTNAGGIWVGTAELVDFSGNVLATAIVDGTGAGFIHVPFDGNATIAADTLAYLRFTNTEAGPVAVTGWYLEILRGVQPVITVAPTLTWTTEHGTSPVMMAASFTGPGTLAYDLVRLPDTAVLAGVTEAAVEAYVSDRATDVGPSWVVRARVTSGNINDFRDSNEVAWYPDVWSGVRALHDAADVTVVGADVDVWQDLSGNGNSYDAASSGVRPLYSSTGFNGGTEPYVEGDGVTEWLRELTFGWGGAPTQSSFHAAAHVVTPANGRTLWRYAGVGVRPALTQATSDRVIWYGFDATGQVSTLNSITNARTISVISAQGGTQKIRFAGIVDPADRTDGADAHLDSATMGVFASHNGTTPSHLRLAMLVVRSVATSDAERLDWQAYSTWRWGLPI